MINVTELHSVLTYFLWNNLSGTNGGIFLMWAMFAFVGGYGSYLAGEYQDNV